LGIQDPRGPADRIFAAMDVSESTFSTSGDYARFFIKDGRRYHHILDPATGEPAEGCRSVTIRTGRATVADGLSTGVFILGPEAKVNPVNLVLQFEAINADEGTARLEASVGAYDITVRYAGGYMHFIQSFLDGPLYTTTVLEKQTSGGKLKAMHSRHEYTDVT